MGVMGLIMGGLLASMRQVIEGETLLKKMQAVEEETRFIMDAFAQDAEYSELDGACCKPTAATGDIFVDTVRFKLTEKKSELESGGTLESAYTYGSSGSDYYLKRAITDSDDPANPAIITMNNTPLSAKPIYRIRLVETPDGSDNYLTTVSLVYRVTINDQPVQIPVETSAMSRTFEF